LKWGKVEETVEEVLYPGNVLSEESRSTNDRVVTPKVRSRRTERTTSKTNGNTARRDENRP